MISYFFRFVSRCAIMQVGGGGDDRVYIADAWRGAVGACQHAGLAGHAAHRGSPVGTGEGCGHRGGPWTLQI